MSTTLYIARYLLPIGSPLIEDGALLLDAGRIAAVGQRRDLLENVSPAQVVDFGDAVLLPPMVNAHTHLELTHFPEWAAAAGEAADAEDFVGWILRMIRVKRSLNPEAYAPSLLAGLRQSLAAGTGAVADILSQPTCVSTYADSPLFGRVYGEILGQDRPRYAELCNRMTLQLGQLAAPRLTAGLAPHSPYTLGRALLADCVQRGRQQNLPLTLHLAESHEEKQFLASAQGPLADRLFATVGWQEHLPLPAHCSPVAYADEAVGLGSDILLAHGVQVDEADIKRLAAKRVPVALCPRSNARLDVGRAPLDLYLKHDVHLCLGTDSLASNDSLSMWEELAFARTWFAGQADAPQLLAMATLGGAQALGLTPQLGTLQPGWGANFQVLQLSSTVARGELLDYLTSPGLTADVAGLYLDGHDVLQSP